MSKFRRNHTKSAKLTAEQVLSIRDAYAAGTTQGELARTYQMSVGTIGRIVRGESWTSLGGAEDPKAVSEAAAASLARLRAMQEAPLPSEAIVPPASGAAQPNPLLEKLQSAIAQERKAEDELNQFVKSKNPYY